MAKQWIYYMFIAGVCGLGYSKTGESNVMIFRNGCYKDGNFSSADSEDLPNNAPGTCLAFCIRKQLPTDYMLLQGTRCSCTSSFKTNISTTLQGCTEQCPGHDSHYCGNSSSKLSSVYKIENTTHLINSNQCLIFKCGKGYIPESCDELHTPLCVLDLSSGKNCSVSSPKGTWEDAQSSCKNSQMSIHYTNKTLPITCSTCGNGGLGSDERWIGGFGQWAPEKNCTPTMQDITSITAEVLVLDDYTVYFNCSQSTHYCLSDGTWSNNLPACIYKTTVTKVPSITTHSTNRKESTTQPTIQPTDPFSKTTVMKHNEMHTEMHTPIPPEPGNKSFTAMHTIIPPEQERCIKEGIMIGVCVGVGVLSLLVIAGVVVFNMVWNRKKKNKVSQSQSPHSATALDNSDVPSVTSPKQNGTEQAYDKQGNILGQLSHHDNQERHTPDYRVAQCGTVDKADKTGYTVSSEEANDKQNTLTKRKSRQVQSENVPKESQNIRHEKQSYKIQNNTSDHQRAVESKENESNRMEVSGRQNETQYCHLGKLPPIVKQQLTYGQSETNLTADKLQNVITVMNENGPLSEQSKTGEKRKKKRKLTALNMQTLTEKRMGQNISDKPDHQHCNDSNISVGDGCDNNVCVSNKHETPNIPNSRHADIVEDDEDIYNFD